MTGNLSGFWRYRVGNYRIIASIEDDELLILAINIDHRSRIYR
nr:type II toxin-antitoxin system RelE/ParE family toxin [Actinomyces sp. HPA0247]